MKNFCMCQVKGWGPRRCNHGTGRIPPNAGSRSESNLLVRVLDVREPAAAKGKGNTPMYDAAAQVDESELKAPCGEFEFTPTSMDYKWHFYQRGPFRRQDEWKIPEGKTGVVGESIYQTDFRGWDPAVADSHRARPYNPDLDSYFFTLGWPYKIPEKPKVPSEKPKEPSEKPKMPSEKPAVDETKPYTDWKLHAQDFCKRSFTEEASPLHYKSAYEPIDHVLWSLDPLEKLSEQVIRFKPSVGAEPAKIIYPTNGIELSPDPLSNVSTFRADYRIFPTPPKMTGLRRVNDSTWLREELLCKFGEPTTHRSDFPPRNYEKPSDERPRAKRSSWHRPKQDFFQRFPHYWDPMQDFSEHLLCYKERSYVPRRLCRGQIYNPPPRPRDDHWVTMTERTAEKLRSKKQATGEQTANKGATSKRTTNEGAISKQTDSEQVIGEPTANKGAISKRTANKGATFKRSTSERKPVSSEDTAPLPDCYSTMIEGDRNPFRRFTFGHCGDDTMIFATTHQDYGWPPTYRPIDEQCGYQYHKEVFRDRYKPVKPRKPLLERFSHKRIPPWRHPKVVVGEKWTYGSNKKQDILLKETT